MKRAKWIGGDACRMHGCCATCRADDEHGRNFRTKIAEYDGLEGEDFNCPEGFTADCRPEPGEALALRQPGECEHCLAVIKQKG